MFKKYMFDRKKYAIFSHSIDCLLFYMLQDFFQRVI